MTIISSKFLYRVRQISSKAFIIAYILVHIVKVIILQSNSSLHRLDIRQNKYYTLQIK